MPGEITIYIWKLRREEAPQINEWYEVIVAAATERSAREQANQEAGAEGYVWTDSSLVTAKRLGVAEEGVSGILMHSTEDQD